MTQPSQPSQPSSGVGARRPPRRLRALAVLAVPALLFGACSSSGDESGTAAVSGDVAEADAGARADFESGVADGSGGDTALRSARNAAPDEQAPDVPTERAVISTGNVALHSDDVEQAAFDAQQVVDGYAGEITEQKTSTDEDGEVVRVRMVLRVPAADFAAAFDDLEQVADLTSSGSSSEDVTTEVIDTAVRIRAQRRSLARVEVLLDRATSISDIVRIEAQLTRRQAALDSLEQRQAYLADQTSLSTITVSIEKTDEEERTEPEEDDGFLAGLSSGWSALVAFGTGLATATGWALPFAIVLLVIGAPVWLVRRRRARRQIPSTPSTPSTD